MSPKTISCILFDFDGVLIDSEPAMNIAWNSVQKKYGVKKNFFEYKQYIGLPFKQILLKLNINTSLHEPIKNYYSKVSSQNKNLIKLNPYVKYILNWLKVKEIKTGIVTSKDKVRTYELVEFFQLNIKTLITPELTKEGKPSSEPILYAAKTLNVSSNEVLYVGDMLSDMLCAYNSKCLYLHYQSGYQKINNQIYGGQISSLKEIIEYVLNF